MNCRECGREMEVGGTTTFVGVTPGLPGVHRRYVCDRCSIVVDVDCRQPREVVWYEGQGKVLEAKLRTHAT